MNHLFKTPENTPLLETERLILRRFTKDDLSDFFLIMNDKEVNTYLPWFPVENLAQAEIMLQERYLHHYKQPAGYHYAICLQSDHRPIGYVNISDDDSHDFGYGLRKEFWHQGIVTEACKKILTRLETSGIPYLTATHDRNNHRSGQVMKNLGMDYRYSYEEQCQPKDITVIFRMYQLNFDGSNDTYWKYWNNFPNHFVENGL